MRRILTAHQRKPAKGSAGFWFAQGLALVFLAICLFRVYLEAGYALTTSKITGAIDLQDNLAPVLVAEVSAFGAIVLLVHALLGFIAYRLARLTETSFPGLRLASRRWLVTGWFVLIVGLVLAANTTWYPASLFAGETSVWRVRIAGVHPVVIVAALVAALVALLAWRSRALFRAPRISYAIAAAAMALLAASAFVPARFLDASATRVEPAHPNIIIIGIDSLRNDLTVPRLGAMQVPNITAFLAASRRFSDAVTPLARTYPSWISILTGRHPVSTNARYNLMPRHLVHEGGTLADALRARGYSTAYATDEVRFANIDGSFGFDRCITPPIGAIDFLLGLAGDIPLVNVVAPTRIGGLLFPSNHANRAAYVTYRPRDFTERLDRELEIAGPSFVAIHLTLAHWPYAWAGHAVPSDFDAYRHSYGAAAAEVDHQFGEVLALLRAKGALDNAIVVLLSDHGEALGADNDSMLRKTGTSDEIWETLWGHGTSVLSPNQYQVVLAMRAFGRAELPGPDRDYDWPVSLLDVRPTLEEYATGRAPGDVDGQSLLPYMADPANERRLAGRVRFTETDFNTPAIARGHYDASGIVNAAASYYEVDRESGWVQLRPDRLKGLIRSKQRAAMTSDMLLAWVPTWDGKTGRYLLTDRHAPLPSPLSGRPDPARQPVAAHLWDALQGRFPGELPADPAPPRM